MKYKALSTIFFLLSASSALALEAADRIYYGGPIVTADDKNPLVEAVAVKNGKILATGKVDELTRLHKGQETKL